MGMSARSTGKESRDGSRLSTTRMILTAFGAMSNKFLQRRAPSAFLQDFGDKRLRARNLRPVLLREFSACRALRLWKNGAIKDLFLVFVGKRERFERHD